MIAGLSLSGCKKDDGGVPVAGVSLKESSKTLTVGETFAMTATVAPDNATNKTLSWTSSNTAIATVSDGTVTAIAPGEAVITVKTEDGNKTAACTVTVEQARITMTVAERARYYTTSIDLTGSGTAVVDWGDERSETITLTATRENYTHTYSSTNSHTITITGDVVMFYCNNFNQMTALDVSKNLTLTSIACQLNQLSTLDVSKNTALTYLDCSFNQMSALDVSKNTALTYLYCNYNQLSALDVSKNPALTSIVCASNQLSTLDVSKNTELTLLACDDNPLNTFDVSNNTELTVLSCDNNQLTALDVSKNTALTRLYCRSNQLTAFDVSNNTGLTHIFCDLNQLSALDVSTNTALYLLSCHNNQLSAAALDALFGTLHSNTIPDVSKVIKINRNPGTSSCDRSIATNKGWVFSDF